MRLPPVMVVSVDERWIADTADALFDMDLMVYCARGVDQAIHFLRIGVAPALLVLDGRARTEIARFTDEVRQDPRLQGVPVVTVDAEPDESNASEPPPEWLSTRGPDLGHSIRSLLDASQRTR